MIAKPSWLKNPFSRVNGSPDAPTDKAGFSAVATADPSSLATPFGRRRDRKKKGGETGPDNSFLEILAKYYKIGVNDFDPLAALMIATFILDDPDNEETLYIHRDKPLGSGADIEIWEDAVMGKKGLSLETALEIAMLAKANPALAGGVHLVGDERDQMILAAAAMIVGLAVLNPPNAPREKMEPVVRQAQAVWQTMAQAVQPTRNPPAVSRLDSSDTAIPAAAAAAAGGAGRSTLPPTPMPSPSPAPAPTPAPVTPLAENVDFGATDRTETPPPKPAPAPEPSPAGESDDTAWEKLGASEKDVIRSAFSSDPSVKTDKDISEQWDSLPQAQREAIMSNIREDMPPRDQALMWDKLTQDQKTGLATDIRANYDPKINDAQIIELWNRQPDRLKKNILHRIEEQAATPKPATAPLTAEPHPVEDSVKLPESESDSLFGRVEDYLAESGHDKVSADDLARDLGIDREEAEAVLKEMEDQFLLDVPDSDGRRTVFAVYPRNRPAVEDLGDRVAEESTKAAPAADATQSVQPQPLPRFEPPAAPVAAAPATPAAPPTAPDATGFSGDEGVSHALPAEGHLEFGDLPEDKQKALVEYAHAQWPKIETADQCAPLFNRLSDDKQREYLAEAEKQLAANKSSPQVAGFAAAPPPP